MAKTNDTKETAKRTSLGIYRVTAELIDELATMLGEERGMVGPFPKHEAVHQAVQEAIAKRSKRKV